MYQNGLEKIIGKIIGPSGMRNLVGGDGFRLHRPVDAGKVEATVFLKMYGTHRKLFSFDKRSLLTMLSKGLISIQNGCSYLMFYIMRFRFTEVHQFR